MNGLNRFLRNVGVYLLIILVAISISDYFSTRSTQKHEVSYTNFLTQVDAGDVSRVTFVKNTIRGVLKDGTEFVTITPDEPYADAGLYDRLKAKDIEIDAANPPEPSWWSQLLSSIFPFVILLALGFSSCSARRWVVAARL